MTDYKERIRKLLALAESPNEQEAKAALLKAQKLMAEHKISQADIRLSAPGKQTIEHVDTEIYFTSRTDPWILDLSSIIAENFSCEVYYNSKKTRRSACFLGWKEDARLAKEMMVFACDFIHNKFLEIKKAHKGESYQAKKFHCTSYAQGFLDGLEAAFEEQKQQNEQEWGLILVAPKEATDYIDSLSSFSFHSEAMYSPLSDYFSQGYEEGKNFSVTKDIDGPLGLPD